MRCQSVRPQLDDLAAHGVGDRGPLTFWVTRRRRRAGIAGGALSKVDGQP